jgi:hypothetical protein
LLTTATNFVPSEDDATPDQDLLPEEVAVHVTPESAEV